MAEAEAAAGGEPAEEGRGAVVGRLRGSLAPLLEGLRGGEAREEEAAAAGCQAGQFWEALGRASQAASHAATKLSLALARAPLPDLQAQERLAEEVRGGAVAVVAAFYQLPKDQGATLRRAVREAAAQVLEGLIQLTHALLWTPPLQSLSQEQLTSTGSLWQACDRLSSLPPDNQAAVASVLSSCLGVVSDALEEMEQAQAEGGDPSGDVLEDEEMAPPRGNWSAADRELLGPCLGLVKAARACLKKVLGAVRARGKVGTPEQVGQLDDIADIAGNVSPSVDELALSAYPPVNPLALRLNAATLASVLKKMLEAVRMSHLCPPSEETWVLFLSGAVDHNMGRIKHLTQELL